MPDTNPNPHKCFDVDSIEKLDYMNMNVEVTSLMPLHVICGYSVRDYLVMYTIEGERGNSSDVSCIHQMYSFIIIQTIIIIYHQPAKALPYSTRKRPSSLISLIITVFNMCLPQSLSLSHSRRLRTSKRCLRSSIRRRLRERLLLDRCIWPSRIVVIPKQTGL